MKKIQRLLAMFFALSMFASSAFANTNNVRSLMRDYQIQVRVENVNPQDALKNLTHQLLEKNVTRAELIEYVQSTMSADEFSQFLAMLETGTSELASRTYVDQNEFQQILGQVFMSSQQNMGANYNAGGGGSCYSRYFGYVAVAVSVVLALTLVQRRVGEDTWLGDLLGRIDINLGDNLSDQNLAIATAVSGALGFYLLRRC